MTIVFIPQAIIFNYTESILLTFGQEPQIAFAAAEYTRILVPGVLFFNLFEATRRFLNAQMIFDPPSKVQFLTLALHLVW